MVGFAVQTYAQAAGKVLFVAEYILSRIVKLDVGVASVFSWSSTPTVNVQVMIH